jgi:CRP/FNR family cyclic AMP-dependent transcriptional regulator
MPVEVESISSVPLFAELTEEELAELAGMFERRNVTEGTRLIVEGASGYTFFVIENGTMSVDHEGRLLDTLGPGDFFGEMAIISGERRNATVTATTEANVLVLFGTEFRKLEREWPGAVEKIFEKVAERNARLAGE